MKKTKNLRAKKTKKQWWERVRMGEKKRENAGSTVCVCVWKRWREAYIKTREREANDALACLGRVCA